VKELKANKDPFFGLKYIAYCRTGLPINDEDIDEEALISYAKACICKARNKLWNDPIWDSYTQEEILVEYFTIRFESEDARKEFETKLISVKKSDLDWFETAEKRYMSENKKENDIITQEPTEFEDTF
jgi:hypothetical protein